MSAPPEGAPPVTPAAMEGDGFGAMPVTYDIPISVTMHHRSSRAKRAGGSGRKRAGSRRSGNPSPSRPDAQGATGPNSDWTNPSPSPGADKAARRPTAQSPFDGTAVASPGVAPSPAARGAHSSPTTGVAAVSPGARRLVSGSSRSGAAGKIRTSRRPPPAAGSGGAKQDEGAAWRSGGDAWVQPQLGLGRTEPPAAGGLPVGGNGAELPASHHHHHNHHHHHHHHSLRWESPSPEGARIGSNPSPSRPASGRGASPHQPPALVVASESALRSGEHGRASPAEGADQWRAHEDGRIPTRLSPLPSPDGVALAEGSWGGHWATPPLQAAPGLGRSSRLSAASEHGFSGSVGGDSLASDMTVASFAASGGTPGDIPPARPVGSRLDSGFLGLFASAGGGGGGGGFGVSGERGPGRRLRQRPPRAVESFVTAGRSEADEDDEEDAELAEPTPARAAVPQTPPLRLSSSGDTAAATAPRRLIQRGGSRPRVDSPSEPLSTASRALLGGTGGPRAAASLAGRHGPVRVLDADQPRAWGQAADERGHSGAGRLRLPALAGERDWAHSEQSSAPGPGAQAFQPRQGSPWTPGAGAIARPRASAGTRRSGNL